MKGPIDFDPGSYSSYQWKKGDVVLTGKTSRMLTLDSIYSGSVGVYCCIIDGVIFSREFIVTSIPPTSVEEHSQQSRPAETMLLKNYPNPFNPSTHFEFSLPASGRAILSVYDVSGREIAKIFDGFVEPTARYTVTYNADHLPSGIYFARLTQGASSIVSKIVLMK